MATKAVSPRFSSGLVSPHFDGANRQLKDFVNFVSPRRTQSAPLVSPHFDAELMTNNTGDFLNATGDPYQLDGTWKTPIGNITIKDNYVMNYATIPPRAIKFTGGNKIQFNFGYDLVGEVIGGDTIHWGTGEIWTKIGGVPAGTESPKNNMTKYLIWGGAAIVALGLTIFLVKKFKKP